MSEIRRSSSFFTSIYKGTSYNETNRRSNFPNLLHNGDESSIGKLVKPTEISQTNKIFVYLLP